MYNGSACSFHRVQTISEFECMQELERSYQTQSGMPHPWFESFSHFRDGRLQSLHDQAFLLIPGWYSGTLSSHHVFSVQVGPLRRCHWCSPENIRKPERRFRSHRVVKAPKTPGPFTQQAHKSCRCNLQTKAASVCNLCLWPCSERFAQATTLFYLSQYWLSVIYNTSTGIGDIVVYFEILGD